MKCLPRHGALARFGPPRGPARMSRRGPAAPRERCHVELGWLTEAQTIETKGLMGILSLIQSERIEECSAALLYPARELRLLCHVILGFLASRSTSDSFAGLEMIRDSD
jgi:hypothetical protein